MTQTRVCLLSHPEMLLMPACFTRPIVLQVRPWPSRKRRAMTKHVLFSPFKNVTFASCATPRQSVYTVQKPPSAASQFLTRRYPDANLTLDNFCLHVCHNTFIRQPTYLSLLTHNLQLPPRPSPRDPESCIVFFLFRDCYHGSPPDFGTPVVMCRRDFVVWSRADMWCEQGPWVVYDAA
jgi:hypothetical protein